MVAVKDVLAQAAKSFDALIKAYAYQQDDTALESVRATAERVTAELRGKLVGTDVDGRLRTIVVEFSDHFEEIPKKALRDGQVSMRLLEVCNCIRSALRDTV